MTATPPIETRKYSQLPVAATVPGDALVAIEQPGGALQSARVAKLFQQLLAVDTVADTVANLSLAFAAGKLALVYAEPPPGKTGYYIKTGASGAGAWEFSDFIAQGVSESLQSLVTDAETAAADATTQAGLADASADAAAASAASVAAPFPSLDLSNFRTAELGTDDNLIWGVDKALGPVGPFSPLALNTRRFDRDATTNLFATREEGVIYLFPVFGQSWAAGQNSVAEAPLTAAAIDPGFALMLSSGPWPNGDLNTGIVDLYEIAKSVAKQSICSSFAKSLNDRLFAAIGRRVQVLMTVAALSGSPYKNIKRGSATWDELLRIVREARDFAAAQGKRIVIPGVLVLLGASDATDMPGSTAELQRRFFEQLQADLTNDLGGIAPQSQPIRVFPWVPDPSRVNNQNWPEVAVGYSELVRQRFMRPVGCMYSLERNDADKLHLDRIGYYKAGEMFADAVLNECFGLTGGPLYAIDAWRSGSATFDVRFSLPITIDDTGAIVATTGLTVTKGFSWSAANGVAGSTASFSSVAAVAGPNANIADTLRVTMTAPPAAGRFSLMLACFNTGSGSGPATGARSLIRSTAAYAASGQGGSLYHWALPAKLDFTI